MRMALPMIDKFQSTLSVRRATRRQTVDPRIRAFQSTLSVRRATSKRLQGEGSFTTISIHALRKESDWNSLWSTAGSENFNPRSP